MSRDVSPFLKTSRTRLFRVGTADYLQTLRVTPVEGRLLDARDGADAPLAVVVNETLVRQFMPGQSALGRRIRFNPTEPWFTIVGVVKDVVERGYQQESKPGVYVAAGTGATLLSDGQSDRARGRRPARICGGRPADRS